MLLDVQMPELSGLEVAAALGDDGPNVIFATAHEAHAIRAFELAAVDYLLKPVDKVRLAAALARVRKRETARGGALARSVIAQERRSTANADASSVGGSGKMAVRVGQKYVVFDTERIVAILAQDHYAAILVDGRELLSDDSLDRFMDRLDPTRFLRVHRSAIVNVTAIRELEQEGDRKFVAIMDDQQKTRVPISRERLEEVKARVGIES